MGNPLYTNNILKFLFREHRIIKAETKAFKIDPLLR
jgi:hypothetical protein